jgi:acyl-CoA synthetase (AMP-forming)/AMP-acid ligase II
MALPLPDNDAHKADAEVGERALATGEIGELIVRSPQVMEGYWKHFTRTASALRIQAIRRLCLVHHLPPANHSQRRRPRESATTLPQSA